ncbi:MAG: YcxB family protein [Oscillospiraceae bacterium]|nr:YcxB family protein [Oscillospiraceae bacterium]
MPILKFKHTSKYYEKYTLIFTNEGINFKTPSVDSNLQWAIYSEIWENDDFYYLIQAPRIYTLIPKRTFNTTADRQYFEDCCLSNIQKPKRVL